MRSFFTHIFAALFILPALADPPTIIETRDLTLATKNYFDTGLAAKGDALPPIAGKANNALYVNVSETSVEWRPITGVAASHIETKPTIAVSGWALIDNESGSNYNMVRKDVRTGIVAVNLCFQKTTAATSIASGSNISGIIKFPSNFYIDHPNTHGSTPTKVSWILAPLSGYGAGAEPNSLVVWYDASGNLGLWNYGSATYSIPVNWRACTNFTYPAVI
jgi:hypothetical protein